MYFLVQLPYAVAGIWTQVCIMLKAKIKTTKQTTESPKLNFIKKNRRKYAQQLILSVLSVKW